MIVSASRRTDIPALYWDWFLNRLRAGYALARNPMNLNQVKRVDLTVEGCEGFVFWTKNAESMLQKIDPLDGRAYYFQYTITPYGTDVEPRLPGTQARIDALRRLADRIGADRVHWRYDPVLLTGRYPLGFHEDMFHKMAEQIQGYARGCTFSFLDRYRKIERNLGALGAERPDEAGRHQLAQSFAKTRGMPLYTCCEGTDYAQYGVRQGRCVDAGLLSGLAGRLVADRPEKNQRPGCACAQSTDIGAYDTCTHGCKYCYATASDKTVAARIARHDPASAFMVDS